jgi:hypothetical protein
MPKYRIISSKPVGAMTSFEAEFIMDDGHTEIQTYVGSDERVLQEAALHMQSELDSRAASSALSMEVPEAPVLKEVTRVGGRIEVRELS